MKDFKWIMIAMIIGFTNLLVAQQSEAPYFIIENTKPGDMPLEASHAEVYISGIIADVTLTQTYRNNSDSTMEAIYVFPGSSQSAIYDMEMQIGTRIIKAELEEKDAAKLKYKKARQEGKRTSLLEQHRPNVFQMNVANILPGERIKVRIKYTEKLIPENGNYQFVLPTVVGPRFHVPNHEHNASFVNMPYTKENTSPSYTYGIDLYLQAGQSIQKISSTSHEIQVKKFSEKVAYINLSETDLYSGNKDFILNYRLSDHSISSGILLYEEEDENFFLATIQPPNFVSDEELPAREYIFIVDISGSMNGFPLEVSKKLMYDLLNALHPTDRFNVLLFAGSSYMFSDTSMLAIDQNIKAVLTNLQNRQGGGGTQLLSALKTALEFPFTDPGLSRSLVLVTDGYISVEKETFELVRNNLDKANVFTFGIGTSTNRFLIEGLANVGQGLPFIVEKQELACDVAENFKRYISTPSLTNISFRTEGFEAFDIEPRTIPDLLGERPINILGKYNGKASGKIIIEGYFAGTKYTQNIDLKNYTPNANNKALSMLWARKKLRLLDDYRKIMYDQSHKAEMLELSLKYNLLSAYTSFVAVDYEVANDGNRVKTIKQALPLPEGVSNMAVGAEMSIKKTGEAKRNIYWKVTGINGINDPEIRHAIKKLTIKNLRDLKRTIGKADFKTLEINLIFDDEGLLDNVEFNQKFSKEVKEQLRNRILAWKFDGIIISPKSDIQVLITLI